MAGLENKNHNEQEVQKPNEGDVSKKLEDAKIKPENTDTLKKLGFTFEKNEVIDQKTLEAKMGDKFDKMSESVGKGNTEAQAELNNIKQEFIKNLGTETDINKQLELCEQFLKEFDNEQSQEI